MNEIRNYLRTMLDLENKINKQNGGDEVGNSHSDAIQSQYNDNYITRDTTNTLDTENPNTYSSDDDFSLSDFEDYDDCGECEIEPIKVDDPHELVAWVDTTNFVISARRLTEFLGEVLYNPDSYIGTIEGYEDYAATGNYYITGMTSVQGLNVSLVFENMDDETVFVNILLNDDGVKIHNVTEANI